MILPFLLTVLGVSQVAAGPASEVARLYERALELRARGSFQAAIPLLQQAAAANPSNRAIVAALAETLGWAKRFQDSEKIYRDAIDRFGRRRDLQIGLARAILWQGRYRDASIQFERLLTDDPKDADALQGRAQAAYWSGDFRRAESLFLRLQAVQPKNPESHKALTEIRAAARSSWRTSLIAVDDSQPFQWMRPEIVASFFSDPLTRWDLGASRYLFDNNGEADVLTLAATTHFPDYRLGVYLGGRIIQFPTGGSEVLGDVRISRRLLANSSISLLWQESELFATATSVNDRPSVSTTSLRWEHNSKWSAAASARRHDYSDGNEGVSADLWLLLPILKRGSTTLNAGPAVSYRDVEEPRFHFLGVEARPAGNGFSYEYRGEYDPYWTPHHLREARLAISADHQLPRQMRLKIQADGGFARDRAIGFGPVRGSSAVPPFPFPTLFDREYHPWRAAAEISIPVRDFSVSIAYRHNVTVFYRSDEVEAILVGRF